MFKIHFYGLSYKRASFNDFIHEQSIIQCLHVSVMYPGLLFFPPNHYKSVQCCGMTWMPALSSLCKNKTSSLWCLIHILLVCVFLQINIAQLRLWQTEQRSPKLEMKNKFQKKEREKNSQGANDREHTNSNDPSGRLISANTFYPKPYFSCNQHYHQQAAFTDSLVNVLSILQFHNLEHFHCRC